MKLKVEIDLGGAALWEGDDLLGIENLNLYEINRILGSVVKGLQRGNESYDLWDVNGNRVGKYRIVGR